jgi:hypothetical protein
LLDLSSSAAAPGCHNMAEAMEFARTADIG